MLVKRQGGMDGPLLHHNKRNAIGERISFVVMFLKVLPTSFEELFINGDKVNRRALQKSVSHLYRFGM